MGLAISGESNSPCHDFLCPHFGSPSQYCLAKVPHNDALLGVVPYAVLFVTLPTPTSWARSL